MSPHSHEHDAHEHASHEHASHGRHAHDPAHGQEGGHAPASPSLAPVFVPAPSLLLAGGGVRFGLVGAALALLWMTVFWAFQP